MSEAARMNGGKPMISFIFQFPTALQAFCRVKEIGAVKYERDNWRKGNKPWYEYIDSAGRHILKYVSWACGMPGSSYYDPDTGCAHLAHAMWNMMALMELNHPGMVYDSVRFERMTEFWTDMKGLSKDEIDAHLVALSNEELAA